MRIGVLAWLSGLLLLAQFKQLPSLYLLLLFPILVLGGVRAQRPMFRALAWLGAGFIWGCGMAYLANQQRLDPRWVGQDITVIGQVAALPDKQQGQQRIEFRIESVLAPAVATFPNKIRLTWRNAQDLLPSQRWQLTVRLKPPHRYANPGSFDYESWLWQQGIGATGYVREQADTQLLVADTGDYPVQRCRQAIRDALASALPTHPYRKVVVALVLGLQTDMDEHDWRLLRDTGTAHLLAISGLHISMVAAVCYLLALWVARHAMWLTQRIAAPRFAALIGLIAAIGYSSLAGFSIPTLRSCLMLCIGFSMIYLQSRRSATDVLLFVLGLVLLGDPFAILNVGFWLSFGTVAIIFFLVSGGAQRTRAAWRESIRMQWAISLGLIPMLIFFFGQFPLYSPIVNLIAIPVVTFVIVPILLVGTALLAIWPWLGTGLLELGAWGIEWLWRFLGWAADLPHATVNIPTAMALIIPLSLLGLSLAALPRGLPGRWLGLLALIPLLFPPITSLDWAAVRLTLLDVGQGLSVVAETQQHVLVFDTGPQLSPHFNTGEAVIAPFLGTQGRTKVDQLIVSHGDMDHRGGAAGLARQLPIGQSLSSTPDSVPFLAATQCAAGQHWHWDGVDFDILHPQTEDYLTIKKGNNRCCVLRIRAAGRQILITADIESLAEHQLVDRYGVQLASDILVVPHHGSLTSSSDEFLEVVQPHYALMATGKFNRFHFPRPEIVARYQQRQITLYDTAVAGAISLQIQATGQITPPQAYRQLSQRIWHDPN